jgi:hypothetical protein
MGDHVPGTDEPRNAKRDFVVCMLQLILKFWFSVLTAWVIYSRGRCETGNAYNDLKGFGWDLVQGSIPVLIEDTGEDSVSTSRVVPVCI